MVEIVELFETGAEGYWNWFCKGLWFPCIAGYRIVFESSSNIGVCLLKKHIKSLEKRLSGKITPISNAYAAVGISGLIFILVGIVLPIALFLASLCLKRNDDDSWAWVGLFFVLLWLWAAMYVIPSLGKNGSQRLFNALQVSAFILILLHYCQRRSFLKRHNRLDTCSEEMGLCFTTWFCGPCSYGQIGATTKIEEVWSLKVLKVICSKLV